MPTSPRRTSTDCELTSENLYATSEILLQGGHWVCLHNSPCRLSFHHHNLPKDFPLASLCRRLLTSLDHAQTRQDKLPCALPCAVAMAARLSTILAASAFLIS